MHVPTLFRYVLVVRGTGQTGSTETLDRAIAIARTASTYTGRTYEIRREVEPRWCVLVCGSGKARSIGGDS